jgi:hypothetical protein
MSRRAVFLQPSAVRRANSGSGRGVISRLAIVFGSEASFRPVGSCRLTDAVEGTETSWARSPSGQPTRDVELELRPVRQHHLGRRARHALRWKRQERRVSHRQRDGRELHRRRGARRGRPVRCPGRGRVHERHAPERRLDHFDYPAAVAAFVRYMPPPPGAPSGEDTLFDRWARYLASEAELAIGDAQSLTRVMPTSFEDQDQCIVYSSNMTADGQRRSSSITADSLT